MNLRHAQTLEKSLRRRAGSMSDLSRGVTTRRGWRCHGRGDSQLEIPQRLANHIKETAESMQNLARKLDSAIEEALRNIEVDV